MSAAHSKKHGLRLFPWVPILVVTVLLVLFMRSRGEGSWFIDPGRFHVSVHRRISCSECHGEISKTIHPDPGSVNRTLNDFYRLDQCAGCGHGVGLRPRGRAKLMV
jgi:hypothetical protein